MDEAHQHGPFDALNRGVREWRRYGEMTIGEGRGEVMVDQYLYLVA
jgi:hypothetical protein